MPHRIAIGSTAFALIAWAGPAAADASADLRPGAYQVDVRLETAQTDDPSESVVLCVTDRGASPTRGLFILTPDTPISACPVANVREGADTLAFDVVCDGPNGGHAEARFETARDSFKGRIAMLMGGKNMRMTEVQNGRRTGDCGER